MNDITFLKFVDICFMPSLWLFLHKVLCEPEKNEESVIVGYSVLYMPLRSVFKILSLLSYIFLLTFNFLILLSSHRAMLGSPGKV